MRDYLNDCQKIEQAMGEVYRKLAGVETYSAKLRSIFERMAFSRDAGVQEPLKQPSERRLHGLAPQLSSYLSATFFQVDEDLLGHRLECLEHALAGGGAGLELGDTVGVEQIA